MSPPRNVVVVLGSGRSGTSLLMQVLGALGMRLSEEMIEARRDNPEGHFEDRGIVRLHADLMRALGAWPYYPLPAGWLDTPAAAATAAQLRAVLRERLRPGGIWGFKDPRTAAVLPLWQRLFAAERVKPRYVLALRDPGKVIESFVRAYETPPELAELVWLARTSEALLHTGADCHIVHYEDWFGRAEEVAAALARHTGLAAVPGFGAVLASLVKPELDRSHAPGYIPRNPDAARLHEALQACRGGDFDRPGLLRLVNACLDALAGAWEWRTVTPGVAPP